MSNSSVILLTVPLIHQLVVVSSCIEMYVNFLSSSRPANSHQTFLDPTYPQRHPLDAVHVEELRTAILDYVQAISGALEVHREVCRDVAFHEALKSRELNHDEVS